MRQLRNAQPSMPMRPDAGMRMPENRDPQRNSPDNSTTKAPADYGVPPLQLPGVGTKAMFVDPSHGPE